VAANESYFEVTQRATPGFIKALRRATIAPEDEGLVIEQAPPREAAATPHARPSMAQARVKPKWQSNKARKKPR